MVSQLDITLDERPPALPVFYDAASRLSSGSRAKGDAGPGPNRRKPDVAGMRPREKCPSDSSIRLEAADAYSSTRAPRAGIHANDFPVEFGPRPSGFSWRPR
jgi:hypothetical protein